jgi:4-diphosphocytidyl-2-C-methyl-D-erythritol kinase
MRAAGLFPRAPARIALEKYLPIASGIGGGSSDAAATLIALSRLANQPIPADLLKLGADVPVCLRRRATMMGGIGEILTDVPPLPDTPVVLVNPGVPLPTADVFRAFAGPFGAAPAIPSARFATPQALSSFLATSDNALTLAAIARVGAIADVLQVIQRQPNCLLSRLSGSGATCFGLFQDVAAATQAAQIIGKMRPNWWVAHGLLKAFPDGVT